MSGERDDPLPEVYTQLRAVAAGYLRKTPSAAPTIQATALVHEAWLQIAKHDETRWRSRTHFAALASKVMRDVLVDEARARKAAKRGGDLQRLTLSGLDQGRTESDVDVLALHDALGRLADADPDQAQIVELRFFGGMTGDEIAETVGVSRRTVVRELKMAQAWLLREMTRDGDPIGG